MMILCFYHNFSCIYYLPLHNFVLYYISLLYIPPHIPSSNIKNIFSSVNSSNLTPVFFKHAHQDNPRVVKK